MDPSNTGYSSKASLHMQQRRTNQANQANQLSETQNTSVVTSGTMFKHIANRTNNQAVAELTPLKDTPEPSAGGRGASDLGVSPIEGPAAIQAPALTPAELADRVARAQAEDIPKVLNAEEARKIQSNAAKEAQKSQAMIDHLIGPNSYNARVQRAVAANALTEQRAAERNERNENKKRMEGISAQDAQTVREVKKASKAQSKARKDGAASERKLVEGMAALVRAAVRGGN